MVKNSALSWLGVDRVCVCVTREMFDKETDLHEINTPPRTHTVTVALYKQELTATENKNLLNVVFSRADSSHSRWSYIRCR